jgi:hypothetical protein
VKAVMIAMRTTRMCIVDAIEWTTMSKIPNVS